MLVNVKNGLMDFERLSKVTHRLDHMIQSNFQSISNDSYFQPMSLPPRENLAAYNALIAVRQQLQQTELCNSDLSKMIENSPPPLNHNDPDLLLLKVSF